MPAQEWSRIVNTTIHEYVRDVEVQILRNRKLLAMLKERGRITFNHAGDLLDWKAKYKRAPMQGYADTDTLTFSRRDRWKTAQLDWRGYAATDAMTKLERLKNKNTEAIVKIYSEIATNLVEDIEDQFGDELYIDGNAAGNTKRIHGIESFLGTSGVQAAGYVGTPSSVYAGLSCVLGNYGGSWSVDGSSNVNWPTGTGDAHFDFWTPLIVSYTNSTGTTGTWSSATKTWPNTCKEAMRFGIVKGKKNKSKKGQLDLILHNDELYRQFLNQLDGEERLMVERGTKKGGLVALGFEDVVNFDGVDVSYEYGIPTNNGYGFSMDNMELMSLQPQLFVPEGPDFDIASQSYRFSIDFFGNARFNPRYKTCWKALG
jgi:hypothetical protein